MEAALLPHSGGRGTAFAVPGGGRYRAADGVNAGVNTGAIVGVNTGAIVGVIAGERWSVLVFWALKGTE